MGQLPEQPRSAGPPRILVVDDDPDVRRISELSLRKLGRLDVAVASSGADAVATAARARFDLILLDVMMPGLDGPATLERLRAQTASAAIPVAFLTAKARPKEVMALLQLGAVGVITKPFDPLQLHHDVRALLPTDAAESA